ncbi:MAG: ATP-grasp domain-containing protein, partial [Ardenticatenaceae bacterium]
ELYQLPLALDFTDPEQATSDIVAYAKNTPLAAILAVDDTGSLLAALASAALGLPHNDPASAEAARNKYRMRQMLATGGIPHPHFRRIPGDADFAILATDIAYPVVVKPLLLSGSRGVIRANTPNEFVAACERLTNLLYRIGGEGDAQAILIEQYISGGEVALEGLLVDGELHVLALFDKPDPLAGPFFEETIYVTPSRLPARLQDAMRSRTREAAAALGLRTGPVHAELRYNAEDVWLIEIAGRSIGGLCGSILEFGTDVCLEEIIIRQAVALPLPSLERTGDAAGVMMIPIPKRGILRAVSGVEEAKLGPHITGVEITAPLDYPLVPLPEGESYLGFIFARAEGPGIVEEALRTAHGKLSFDIEDELPILPY